MRTLSKKILFIVICLGIAALWLPSYSMALTPIQIGDQSELNLYGFFRNNTGMFFQDQLGAAHQNRLATERTWFRGYMDFKITDQLRLWSAIQFVYEPNYRSEWGGNSSLAQTKFENQIQRGPFWTHAKEYSEYRNVNDILREAFVEFKPNKENTFKIGRQIAIWGESLTQRVGDVIHPDNNRFSLTFANLEDTRIPSWMIRAIHDFPNINTSLEWIVNPNLVQNKYRVSKSGYWPMMEDPFSPWVPGARFGFYPEDRNGNLGSFSNYVPMGIDGEFLRDKYPHVWKDIRGGFRTNSTFGGFNFGVSYFHTQEYNPIVQYGNILIPFPFLTGTAGGEDKFYLVYPNKDIFGFYMNKSIQPGVIRTEVIYIPNQPFHTMDPYADTDGVVRRNYIKYLIGYDLQGFLYFQWHKTAPFNITFEHIGEWIPAHGGNLQWNIYQTPLLRYNASFGARISTNWFYDLIETDLVAAYMPWGNSGFLMPSVKFLPPWFNKKLSFNLQYTYLYARTPYKSPFGMFRTKDMAVFTTQLDW